MKIKASLFQVDKANTRGEQLTGNILSGRVSWDATRATPMALDLTIRDQTAINAYTDFLAPFLTVEYNDGHRVTEQLGLFSVAPFPVEHHASYHEAKLDGRDLTWLLDDDHLSDGYNLAASTNVVAAVVTLLAGADLTRVNITPSTKTLPEARSWKSGTSRRQVIDDLLIAIGYVRLYFDRTGIACSSPYVSIKTPRPSVEYPNLRVRILDTVRIEPIVADICNRVIVVKDNASEEPIVVTVQNTSPASRTSIPNTGRVISKTIRDSQVLDAAAALTLGTKELEDGATINHRLTLHTLPDPTRNMHEHYALNLYNDGGEAVAVGNYACTGWSIGFMPNDTHEHTIVELDAPPMEVS